MEARASFNGPSVSKTFVAAILVLVAMGLGAMGGYVTKGLTTGGSAAQSQSQGIVKAAPGSVLRQDDRSFIAQYTTTSPATVEDNGLRNRGGHKDLP